MPAGLGSGFREQFDSNWGGGLNAWVKQINYLVTEAQLIVSLGLSGLEALASMASPSNPYNATDAGTMIASATDFLNFIAIGQGTKVQVVGTSGPNSATVEATNGTNINGYNFIGLNIALVSGNGQ